jgi:hypothetical protein
MFFAEFAPYPAPGIGIRRGSEFAMIFRIDNIITAAPRQRQ